MVFYSQGLETDLRCYVKRSLEERQGEIRSDEVDQQLVGILSVWVRSVQRALQLVDNEVELEIALIHIQLGLLAAFRRLRRSLRIAVDAFFLYHKIIKLVGDLHRS